MHIFSFTFMSVLTYGKLNDALSDTVLVQPHTRWPHITFCALTQSYCVCIVAYYIFPQVNTQVDIAEKSVSKCCHFLIRSLLIPPQVQTRCNMDH